MRDHLSHSVGFVMLLFGVFPNSCYVCGARLGNRIKLSAH